MRVGVARLVVDGAGWLRGGVGDVARAVLFDVGPVLFGDANAEQFGPFVGVAAGDDDFERAVFVEVVEELDGGRVALDAHVVDGYDDVAFAYARFVGGRALGYFDHVVAVVVACDHEAELGARWVAEELAHFDFGIHVYARQLHVVVCCVGVDVVGFGTI